ncbi:MAG TPA: malto-oligosyltrehalose synthase [Gemmatimonadales bacterium]
MRRATYRIQLHAGFGFDDAAAILDYLAALGISHVYTSPYLQAAAGSTHGYDVVDHSRVNEELGGAAAHRRFVDAVKAAGLGHIVDVVPNHMAIAGRSNAWWWDVLEKGPASAYARYFDVDWEAPEERLRNVVLLPVLGDQYGRVLEAGEIRLWREGAAFTIRYHEHVFPVAPDSLDALFARAGVSRAEIAARHPRALAAVDVVIDDVNGTSDRLDELLELQHYRLAWWQAAQRDLGYRRFFDVNSLIGLCAEDETVFRDTHRLVLGWVREGVVDGLRIDHPDGLKDPEVYLRRLQGHCPKCYVVVEKILGAGERLPETWPVAGTTGYDFLNLVGGLFVDPAAEAPLTALYGSFTGETVEFKTAAREKKLLVLREVLGSDVGRLAELLLNVCERHRRHRDYTRHHLTEVLRELLACFPVYRTYARPVAKQISDDDRRYIEEAARRARGFRPDLDGTLIDFVVQILTLNVAGQLESEFVLRFQQLCAPAMAKGVEDTAFYTWNRFIALNEVGGDPSRFGVSPEDFHAAMIAAQARYPETMVTTDTHDAKRGEDVRARLSVLSQLPDAWTAAVREWSAMNERHRVGDTPDRNTEYFLYQTLAGAWPIGAERLLPYMEKAIREAKVHTSWTSPDEGYESAVRGFCDAVLKDESFVASLERFVGELATQGRTVSLAQTILKLTVPGIPDVYQGTELWAQPLVDPDNRRPVDYAKRRGLLATLDGAAAAEVLAHADAGLPKLWLIRRSLGARARHARAFGPEGQYMPLAAKGPDAECVVAFARGGEAITIVPRLSLRRTFEGTTVELPPGPWCDELSGQRRQGVVPVGELLGTFPVALLTRNQ